MEPHLRLVDSVIWDAHGQRVRALWNRIHVRPASETFHEFLAHTVAWTFGEQWWTEQFTLPEGQRHCVPRWRSAFAELTRRADVDVVQTEHGPRYTSTASAPAKALMLLGYDLFCLQAVNKLPEFLVSRLRERRSFQSARYEVSAAAIIARAGFDIEFLDEHARMDKHCEFLARHRATGVEVGVEAKSRVRKGAFHEPGGFEYQGDVAGLVNLVRKAERQGPPGLSLVVFLDVNVPPTPAVPVARKQWVRDALAAADELERRAAQRAEQQARYSVLFATNFGFQFGDEGTDVAPHEYGIMPAVRAAIPLPENLAQAITASLSRYGEIPEEV